MKENKVKKYTKINNDKIYTQLKTSHYTLLYNKN